RCYRLHHNLLAYPLTPRPFIALLFFFTDPAPPDIYTLSLHDALPIFGSKRRPSRRAATLRRWEASGPSEMIAERARRSFPMVRRSEEHTSELQSRGHLVCRLLLEKKNWMKMIEAPARTQPRRLPRAEV